LVWRINGTPAGETINGIPVPPEPDKTLNQSTLAGIDSNNNGVRDDIERMVARNFGTDATAYQQAFAHARTQQLAITVPSDEASQRHLDGIRCLSDNNKLSQLKQITVTTLDTSMRRTAFARAFAGAVISEEGCPT